MNAPRDADDLAPGSSVGEYVVEARVGAGSHATVYRARDRCDGGAVALKVLREGLTSEAERSALARVRHDRVVAFRGLERLADRPVLVFEWMAGGSLSAELARGPWPAAKVEALARDLLAALAGAHAAGVIHRDLKPSNVLLDADGRAKLSDFGIASVGDRALPSATGHIEGSPAYMAPEIVLGGSATERSDLWSLGVLLFSALHGRLPFEGENDVETFFAILRRRPVRPEAVVADLSAGLADLLARCLRKDPVHRPSSCAEALLVLDGRGGVASPDDDDRPLGRDAELGELDAWLRSAAVGAASFVLLRGAEAVGVSTLLAAAGERARDHGLVWIPVAVGDEGFLRPAVRAAARALAARRGARSPEVEAALGRLDPKSGPSAESDAPSEIVRDLEVVLRGAAGARAYLLTIDETHRADADDLRRIDAVVRAITGRNATAITAVRLPAEGPAPLAGLATDPRVRVIDVAPLPGPSVVEVLDRDAGGRLDFEVGSLLAERAGGNLRRARGLLAHLRAVGALVERGGAIVGKRGWRDRAVLPTETERVRARLEALPAPSRDLVEAAAVDVGDIDPVMLARVLGRDERDVVAELGRFADPLAGLFVGSGSAYAFASPEVRDTVLATLSDERRRELHRSFVANLDAHAGLERPERLGIHLDGAGESERAREFLVRAAIDASRRYERERTFELARRAGISADEIRPPVTADVVECVFHLVANLAALRRTEARERLLRMLDAWARKAGDEDVRRRVTISALRESILERNPTVEEVEDLRRAISAVRDPAEAAKGRALLGRLAADEWHHEEAERELLESIRLARQAGRPGLMSQAQDRLGSIYFECGRADEGVGQMVSAIAIHEARGNRANAAISRFKLAMHRFDAEDSMAGERAFLSEIDEIRYVGGEYAAAMARGELARVLRATGELQGSLLHGARAIADLTRLGVHGSIGPARLEHAVVLLAVGDVDGAEAHLRAGLAITGTTAATDGDRRKAAAVEFLVALASGYVARAESALVRSLPPSGSPSGAADEAIPFLVEGLLVAAPDDARPIVAALDGMRDRVPSSRRLAPRALLAAVRRILGVTIGRADDVAISEALASGFVRAHCLVAYVAALWAESVRLARSGGADAAGVSHAGALGRAASAGHVGLTDALRAASPAG